MTRVHKFLRDEDFERAVLLLRAGRACWTETECFGAQNAQPEDELLLMKEIYFADLGVGEFSVTFLRRNFWWRWGGHQSGSIKLSFHRSNSWSWILRKLSRKLIRAFTIFAIDTQLSPPSWCLVRWKIPNEIFFFLYRRRSRRRGRILGRAGKFRIRQRR